MTRTVLLVAKEAWKFGLAIVWIGAAVVGLHALGVIGFSPLEQVRDPGGTGASQPVQRVASESEIRARTADDRARAAFYDFDYGHKILESGNVFFPGRESDPEPPPPPPGIVLPPRVDPLQEAMCKADAAIVARAVSKRVLLNRSETFLFTNHDVEVYEWIRPSATSPRASVAVTGGKVLVGERLIRAEHGTFPDLFKASILVLKRIPKSDGYALVGDPVALPTTDRSMVPSPSTPEADPAREAVVKKYRDLAANCGGRQ